MWLNELWQRWMGQAPRQLRRRRRPAGTRTRLTLEALEERTLLSAPVGTTGDLIAAIQNANTAGGATTITLAANTTFNFTSGYNSTFQALPPITGNITIVGNNDTIERTAPSSTPFRFFAVGSDGSLTLENLTLKGGFVGGQRYAAALGGAIFSSGTLNLTGVTVQSNEAVGSTGANGGPNNGANAYGGGLYVAGGSVSLVNDIFSANHAYGGAGGIGSNGDNVGGRGGNGGEGAGGGIYAAAGSVRLSNDTLSSNRAVGGSGGMGGHASYAGVGGNSGAGMGGGLYVAASSSVTLVNSTLSHNYAAGSSAGYGGSAGGSAGAGGSGGAGMGGGLYVATAGSLTLNNNTFSNNYAWGGNGGNGGAGAWGGSEPLHAFNGGPGGYGGAGGIGLGGGLYVAEGSITLVNNTFYSDSAFGGKGGKGGNGGTGGHTSSRGYNGGTGGVGGGGGGGMGGGLYAAEGSITLINDTLSLNVVLGGNGGNGGNGGAGGHATNSAFAANGGNGGNGGAGGNAQGGGFYVPATSVTYVLANTLIANNVPVAGNGGSGGAGGSGSFSVGGNIGSAGIASGPNVAGSVASSDHDLISDADGSSGFSTAHGDQLGTTANPLNPLLAPLATNGGPTETMALLANSPAIDHGDSKAPGLPATDQRGFPRIVGSAVDIGAFEFGATPGISTDGTQLVIIGNASGTGSNDSATVSVNASGGVSAILNGTTDSFQPGQITSILIALGGGSNTITVLGTPSGVTTDIVSGGSDTVNVGNGTTQNIHGDVDIENPLSSTNIIVNDARDLLAHTVTMQSIGANPIDSQGNSDPWGQISGLLGNGNINYEYGDTKNLTLQTGTGANTINVNGTGGIGTNGTSIVTGAAATINLGNGTLSGLGDTLNIEGASSNNININDTTDRTTRTVTLSNMGTNPADSQSNSDPWGQISGLGGANINYEYDDTKNVTLQTGFAIDNVVNVLATGGSGSTNIVTGDEATNINVGNGTVSGITSTLNLESPSSFNTIVINDASDTTARTVTLSTMGANPSDFEGNSDPWGQVSGLAPAAINYEYGDTFGVTIDGSSHANTYNIQGTGALDTTIDAGNSNDTFNLGSGNSLSGIQGPLTLNAGDGINTLNANDASSARGQSYTLSNTYLEGTDFALIRYASMSAVNVTASGSDKLTLQNLMAPRVTVNGGPGSNTLVGPNVYATWTLSGTNAGEVGNAFFSNFQNLQGGTGSNSFNFTTSTASVSGSINGGGGSNTYNTLSYATLGSSYLVNVKLSSNTSGSATALGGGFSNINYLVGSTDSGNTLIGPNGTNVWSITGSNTGSINTGPIQPLPFTGMAHLLGGSGVDIFRFLSSSGTVLSINGGGAPAGQGNWLHYSSLPSTSPVTVNLATGSATNVNNGAAGSVTNIQDVLGSASGTNHLTGDAQGNILIGGSGVNTIVGGSGNSLLIGGSGSGTISGGSGQDILIAGTTTYLAPTVAGEDELMTILAELQSADAFADKVYDLIHGSNVGDPSPHGHDLNGTNKLTGGGTVRASTGTFTLSGDTSASSAADWFFSNSPSTVSDFNDDGVQDEHNNNAIGVF